MKFKYFLLLVAVICTTVFPVKADEQWTIEVRAPQILVEPLKEIAANYKDAKLNLNFSGITDLQQQMGVTDAATQVLITHNKSEMDKLKGFLLGSRKKLIQKDKTIYPVALAVCQNITIPFNTMPASKVEDYLLSEAAQKIFRKYGFGSVSEK